MNKLIATLGLVGILSCNGAEVEKVPEVETRVDFERRMDKPSQGCPRIKIPEPRDPIKVLTAESTIEIVHEHMGNEDYDRALTTCSIYMGNREGEPYYYQKFKQKALEIRYEMQQKGLWKNYDQRDEWDKFLKIDPSK